MINLRTAMTGMAALGSVLALSLAALGETPKAQAQTDRSGRAYVCMEQSRSDPGEKMTRIIVPAPSLEVMLAKGFVEIDCDRGGFPFAQQIKFRDEICEIAAVQPESMQQQLESILGERPALLCAMAEIAVGQWDAKRGPSK